MSIVSASRLASLSHFGHLTFTQSEAAPSGLDPFGFRSNPFACGNATGNCDSGTGTNPQPSQWIIGIGVPQNLCREINQSRKR